ncbi:hypothetical protein SAMN05444483_1145 [Salegentibacter echinorum]|uniref:Uncharacterized protein n=1 Tax=Salegentibacter echinorum TaxID=1073325 RepID=A0A1M5KB01_SALEC|nr:hypothetical protein [Salegentibacter echinorum]SHG49937.1 hypothetical protein SAMN05444483_1145 [Salegentibacter echinorum]
MSQQINNQNNNPNQSDLEARSSTNSFKKAKEQEKDTKHVLEEDVAQEQSFSERWKTNRFWVIRATYHIFYSVWIVVMAIGGLIAWLIALLFI